MKERRSVKTWRGEKVKFFSEEWRERERKRGSVNDTKKRKRLGDTDRDKR